MHRFGFVLEQTLGHVTHSRNLVEAVTHDLEVEALWIMPGWDHSSLPGKIPGLRNNWTVQAGLTTRRELAAIPQEKWPEVLFFHTQVTAVLLPDWLRRIPAIVSLDATPRQYDELGAAYNHRPGPAWLENWKWRLNRECFRRACHLVTWSEWARSSLVNDYQVPPGKISVLPPGVNTQAWTCPSQRFPGRVVKILFVGGDLERKGGGLLLEAFRRLRRLPLEAKSKDRDPGGNSVEIELHLVTRTSLQPEPGVFVYPNMEPNSQRLKELYYACDIFCLPTLGDCLPMALSEAGAAGMPSVSTRIAAIPEIVQDGETGLLVPPGDTEALMEALRCMIEDPQRRLNLGSKAEHLVRQQFDAHRNAARLLDLMKQINLQTKTEPPAK